MRRMMIDQESACFELRWTRPRVLVAEYTGAVPAEESYVRKTEQMLRSASSPVGLCFDVTHMRSFDRGLIAMHAEAFTRLGAQLAGIALVGARPAARFGAVTVSLISKVPLQTFDARGEAIAWLESLLRPR